MSVYVWIVKNVLTDVCTNVFFKTHTKPMPSWSDEILVGVDPDALYQYALFNVARINTDNLSVTHVSQRYALDSLLSAF